MHLHFYWRYDFMADDVDFASRVIDDQVAAALERLRRNTQALPGAKFCKVCEEEMPEARRNLGFQLCIECAEEAERRDSLFV